MSNGKLYQYIIQVYYFGTPGIFDSTSYSNQIQQLSIDKKFIRLYAFSKSFFLIDENQHTYVIGQNDRAQLGLGYSTSHIRKPTLLKQSFTNYVGCEHYTYAQGSDGLYFWGKAEYGCAPTRKRVDEPILTRAGQVECMSASNSRFHFIENKELYGVGLIVHLGIKMNKISTSKPILIKSHIIQVVCSQHHTLCLDVDGDVYAWGSAINGELGIRQEGYNFKQFFSTPVKIGELSHIRKIACADHYSLALSTKGIIYEWGKGYVNLPFEEAILIKKVGVQGHCIDISCSNARSACIDQLGRLYQWNYQGIIVVPTPLRCENFVCGEDALLFIGEKRMRRVSEHFKQNVKIKLQEIKDFVEMKNSKIKNMFYDENRKLRCLSEINRKNIDKTPLSIEDLMQSRKAIKRKQSLYMINLQRQPSIDISSIIQNKKLSIKLNTKQLSSENIVSLPEIQENSSMSKSKIPLKLINPKLKDALIFDEVNEAILDSERQNPIYIPYEYRDKKVKIIDQPNPKAQQQPTEITKYEYIKRIENGFQNRLIQDNVQMEEDKIVIAYKQSRQYKNDTALYQNKYKRMKAVLDKKQSEMKLLLQDQQ